MTAERLLGVRMRNSGKNLNLVLTVAGIALLASTALSSGIAAPQAADTAQTPPAASLADPSTVLDQQSQLQTASDTPITTTTDTTATETPTATQTLATDGQATTAPATSAQPNVLAKPVANSSDNNLNDAATQLQQMGAPQTATVQEIPPIEAPPGFDLPLDKDLPSAKAADAQKEAELRKAAFDAASSGLMPMKTDEIRKLLEMYDQTQQAVQTPIYPNPKPESTFQTISLDPGTPPVELKTSVGHVTTLSIVDASGQPWPIQDISWAGNFEVLQPETGSNMLRITPLADFAFGNVSMRLIGLNPPVIFTLRTERNSVQVRADVQIPQLGPNGIAAPIQTQVTTTAGDTKLSTILEGVPPSSASKLRVQGIDGRTTAYESGGVTYVRTPYTLLSPAWDSSVRSADGTNVYAMKFTPVLLLSDKGKMVRAQLTKTDASDE